MKVDLINSLAEDFALELTRGDPMRYLFKYNCQDRFQKHWNVDASDFAKMYDGCLQSDYSTRLWAGSRYSPKSAMLHMIEEDKNFCWSMFKDLFNENKEVGLRVSRFLFHCDQALQQLQKKDIKVVSHHHDYQALSLYLNFRFPDTYCIFDASLFAQAGALIGLRNPPSDFEFERFCKLAKTLHMLLMKHPLINKSHPADIETNLLLVHDFYEYLALKQNHT